MSDLPWQHIMTAPHELGGDEICVWNGKRIVLANWRYGWDPTDELDAELPCWCDGRIAINPQPTHWLLLSPPTTKRPYTTEEQRIVDYMREMVPEEMMAVFDDPIGFLISSHRMLRKLKEK